MPIFVNKLCDVKKKGDSYNWIKYNWIDCLENNFEKNDVNKVPLVAFLIPHVTYLTSTEFSFEAECTSINVIL